MSLAHKLKHSTPVIGKKLRRASYSSLNADTMKLESHVVIQSKSARASLKYHLTYSGASSILTADLEHPLPAQRISSDEAMALPALVREIMTTLGPAQVIIEAKFPPTAHKHDRATRMAAAKKMAELWKESGNGPTDGVDYQNRMRAEWQ